MDLEPTRNDIGDRGERQHTDRACIVADGADFVCLEDAAQHGAPVLDAAAAMDCAGHIVPPVPRCHGCALWAERKSELAGAATKTTRRAKQECGPGQVECLAR